MRSTASLVASSFGTAMVLGLAVTAWAQPGDQDGDGIPDDVDNCPVTFNPSQTNSDVASDPPGDPFGDACDNCRDVCNLLQIDTNGDGCGNQCDADVNPRPTSDGIVAIPDYGEVLFRLGKTVPPASPDLDFTGLPDSACGALGITLPDGIVGLSDYGFMIARLGRKAGPGLPPDTDCDGDGLP